MCVFDIKMCWKLISSSGHTAQSLFCSSIIVALEPKDTQLHAQDTHNWMSFDYIVQTCSKMQRHVLLRSESNTTALREACCDCILQMFALIFPQKSKGFNLFLSISYGGEGMSRLRCFSSSRHSSLLTPGHTDLGCWQRQRSNMNRPGLASQPASSHLMKQGRGSGEKKGW